MLERVRKWIALTSLIFVAAIFWGAVTAGLVKYLFLVTTGGYFQGPILEHKTEFQ